MDVVPTWANSMSEKIKTNKKLSHYGFEPGDLEHDMYLCDINAVWANSMSEKIKTNKKLSHSGFEPETFRV